MSRAGDLREEAARRPWLTALLGMALGVGAAFGAWGAALAGAIVVVGLPRIAPRAWMLVWLAVGFASAKPWPPPLAEPVYVSGDARLVSVPRITPTGTQALAEIEGLRVSLRLPVEAEAAPGDVWRVSGVVRPLPEFLDTMARTTGQQGSLKPLESPQRVRSAPTPVLWAIRWRRTFLDFTARWTSPRAAAVLDALCFNADGLLDQQTRDGLRREGTLHIVSASGLHVMVLASALVAFLSLLPIPRPAVLGTALVLLCMFALAAGLQAAILRSVAMWMLGASAYLWRREPDPLSALGASGVAVLLWQPTWALSPGFQLSFVVTAALALFAGGPAAEMRGLGSHVVSHVRQLALASAVATAASAPLVAIHFGIVSVVSVPANLLIAAVVPVLVVGGLVAHAIAGVVPALGIGVASGLLGPLSGWVLQVADWGALPVTAFDVAPREAWWLILIYPCALALWRPHVRPA